MKYRFHIHYIEHESYMEHESVYIIMPYFVQPQDMAKLIGLCAVVHKRTCALVHLSIARVENVDRSIHDDHCLGPKYHLLCAIDSIWPYQQIYQNRSANQTRITALFPDQS